MYFMSLTHAYTLSKYAMVSTPSPSVAPAWDPDAATYVKCCSSNVLIVLIIKISSIKLRVTVVVVLLSSEDPIEVVVFVVTLRSLI